MLRYTLLKTSAKLEGKNTAKAKLSSLDTADDTPRATCDPMAFQTAVTRSFTAPAQRLPPELLGEIFLHLQKHEPSMLELIELDCVIARVCTSWRHIALGTPRLWSSIDVRSDTVDAEKCLRRYLPRSKSCPLEITCDTAGQPGLLPLLCEHASRWQSLILQMSSADYRAVTPIDTPLLLRAKIFISDVVDAEHPGLLRFLQYTPRLHMLLIRGGGIEAAAKLSLPKSPVLTTLHLDFLDSPSSYSLASVLSTIRQYRKTLEILELGFNSDAAALSSEKATGGTMTFPELDFLCVLGVGNKLLPHISTPNLRTLSVDTRQATLPSVLLDFLERGPLNIHTLDLLYNFNGRSASEADIATLLRCMSRMEGLEKMRVNRCPVTEAFLAGLVWNMGVILSGKSKD
ncbi:hypothetical protein BD626DRAFT_629726 [Schizophyllum amplum]|uniref:F-box domain-containing protein n=1 Tax=Schizophyllum amplum TaxID=97359 RepID=A0A550CGP0_9AGAR|nr:hypothetical protein BD626DRAFT_629726 [Auriculariopsis ampla]